MTLRQVCKGLMHFVDKCNDANLPDCRFLNIEMIVKEDICIIYDPPYRIRHEFIYSESDNSRSFNGKITSLENSNLVDVAIRDLEQVLKFQKCNLLELSFLDHQPSNTSKFPNFRVKLSNMFKKLNRTIKTKRLSITCDSQSGIMSILPFIDSETVSTLNLFPPVQNNMRMEFNEISKTEQWKKVKNIHCEFYALNMKIEDMSDFSRTFIDSSKFECFDLQVRKFNDYMEISNIWGPVFYFGHWSQWYFRMKDSDEKILRISIRQEIRRIKFDITELNDVRHRAIVHDYNGN
ncbi:hypothetical protein B9Z55_027065 [Caenorhabditis nigoni]|uniref:DUF38 domain-containing protein n=1 Tax=Caenorhabditis nigoni TaxID=1611254 RepID=A0A2G5SIN2_9PELO|nr:hypothetical protein B9Z55_027065 [Caenorhabditis nigoni]